MKKLIELLQKSKTGSRILIGLLAFVLVSAFVVWPALADEMVDDSVEVISEEEAEATPEPTDEPEEEIVEEPEVSEPEEEVQETEEPEPIEEEDKKEADGSSEEDEKARKAESGEEASDTSEAQDDTSVAAGEEQVDEEQVVEEDDSSSVTKHAVVNPKKREAPAVTIDAPVFKAFDSTNIEWDYLSPEGKNTLKVELENYDSNNKVKFQWYCGNDKVGTSQDTYKIPATQKCGTYTYHCDVYYTSSDGSATSPVTSSDTLTITVNKIDVDVDFFTYDAIPSTLPYTGEVHELPIRTKASVTGVGTVAIVAYKNGYQQDLQDEGNYTLKIVVAEGENYLGNDFRLSETVTIEKETIPATPYEITCDKPGNKIGGVQWYRDNVTFVPAEGYSIKDNDSSYDYANSMTVTAQGEDVGPRSVTLRNNSNRGLTDSIDVTETIAIDKEDPTGSFLYGGEGNSSDTIYAGDGILISVEGADNLTASEDIKYEMAYTETPTTNYNSLVWQNGNSISVSDIDSCTVYARLTDEAGNVNVINSAGIVIDDEDPVITCGDRALKNPAEYVAESKEFIVRDANLSSVTVQEISPSTGNVESQTISEGASRFTLTSPDNGITVYKVEARDLARNTTTREITMIDPVTDVTVNNISIKALDGSDPIYGYEEDLAKELVLTPVAGNNTGDPVINEVTSTTGDNHFYYDAEDGKMHLTAGLDAGTYSEVFKVEYTSVEYGIESVTSFTCTAVVQKKSVNVTYAGSAAYYHTIPVFGPEAYEFDGFLAADIEGLGAAEIWSKLGIQADMEYFIPAENVWRSFSTVPATTDQLAGGKLRPVVSETLNYRFQASDASVDENLKVTRRELEGLNITGVQGDHDWYISSVTAEVADGYKIAITGDTETQAANNLSYSSTEKIEFTNEAKENKVSYYVQNIETGEISVLMTKDFKIDKTSPVNCKITVADDSFEQFLNTITFGKFFNETKEVSITGSENISEVDGTENGAKLQYYLSSTALSESEIKSVTGWTDYSGKFNLTPEDYSKVVVYAKATNEAGLSTYCSSDGLVFDNASPDITAEGYVSSAEKKNTTQYVADNLTMHVTDNNLTSAKLYEGTNTSSGGINILAADNSAGEWSVSTESWSNGESKTYTIVAIDVGRNVTKKIFTVMKPVYDISVENITLTNSVYGYTTAPSSKLRWKNTGDSNTTAKITDVSLSNPSAFVVSEQDGQYIITAKEGLSAGTYTSNMTVSYDHNKQASAKCSFVVEKATLTATYLGESVYYHMTPTFNETTIQVRGFMNDENASTASGYEAPTIEYNGSADASCVLTPTGGKADNYDFKYVSGVLTVTRKKADMGDEGQYHVEGTLSDTQWYISDITIRPNDGYKIALDNKAEDVVDNIVITKDTNNGKQAFYLMNEATGELYEKTEFVYKKDAVTPVISGVKDGTTYVVNSQDVTVTDDYLANVTVNGEAQEIINGKSTFTLTANEKNMVYVIVASDYAGNTKELSVILKQPSEVTESDDKGTALTGGTSTQDPGTIKKKVQIVEGAPKVTISSSAKDTAAAVLTTAEQNAVNKGSDANIELRIKSIDGSVSQADKEAIIASLGDYIVGQYLDITVWKTVGSGSAKKVEETKNKISITVTVPESLRNTKSSVNRSFAIFRVHNGSVTKLSDNDSSANTVTFLSDKFSTYALAYRDTSTGSTTTTTKATKKTSISSSSGSGASTGSTKSSGSSSSGSGTTTVSTKSSGTSTGSGGSSKYLYTSSPKTGDSAPIIPVTIALVVALAGIIVSIVLIRKKKNEE